MIRIPAIAIGCPRTWCCRCGKNVDFFESSWSMRTGDLAVRVRCHGAVETAILPASYVASVHSDLSNAAIVAFRESPEPKLPPPGFESVPALPAPGP